MPTAKSKSKKKAASRKKAGSSSAADLPKPLTIEQVKKRLKPREALAAPPAKPLVITQLLAGGDRVTVKVTSSEVEHARLSEPTAKAHQLNISVHGAALGVHAFPPTVQLKRFNANRRLLIPESGSNILDGKLPDHLPSRPFPKQLDRFLKVPPRIQAIRKGKSDKRIYEATTVFPPEDRYTFNDTSFPWCTTGRVETPGGIASGVMVGPRHLLTVSHTIQWNSDNTAGWVKFTPSYFDGSEPFGVAWGEWVYFEVKVVGPGIDHGEGQHDYVVVVLNTRMGDSTGWMGSRTYSDSWDGGTYWSHIGYPGDLASAERPSYQSAISLDGDDGDPQEHQNIYHLGDVWPGQSGGPLFGWWDGEPWPRTVSVQSWQNSNTNGASGGSHMVDLIIRARNEFS